MAHDIRNLVHDVCGPVVPLNIPFKGNEEVDYETLGNYVDWLAGEGVPILILTFGSSEMGSLTDREVYEITKVAAEANKGRAHFVGATRCWPIEESVKYIEFAAKYGATAVKIQPNFFSGLVATSDTNIEYFRTIGERARFPLWAYTLLQNGSNSLSAHDVKRLAEEAPWVIALKNDGEAMYMYYDYVRAAGARLQIVSGGQMKTLLLGWQLGARAYLCPITPFYPKAGLKFVDCLKKGDIQEAYGVIKRWEDPVIGLANRYDWLALIKSLLQIAGLFPSRKVRLPGHTASEEQFRDIRQAYERIISGADDRSSNATAATMEVSRD